MGGDDNLPTSVGHGGQTGPRNSPTVLNAVFNVAQFWDWRAEDLKAQAKGPVQAGVEMANKPENVVVTLKSTPEYVERFAKAFPNEQDPVTFDNMAKAIEAFEVTLVTPGSPFDDWIEVNDAAMTDAQKQGLDLYIEKGCSTCHAGVNFGGQDYFPFGLIKKPGVDILTSGRQGSLRGHQDRLRRVRLPRRTAPQYRSCGALLSLVRGLGSRCGGCADGHRPARHQDLRPRSGPHRRLPACPRRGAADDRVSDPPGRDGSDAASRRLVPAGPGS
jgi:cytochrome c peroxidase